jgi:hypothetical protein
MVPFAPPFRNDRSWKGGRTEPVRISPDHVRFRLVRGFTNVGNRHGPVQLHRISSSATLEQGQARRPEGPFDGRTDGSLTNGPAGDRCGGRSPAKSGNSESMFAFHFAVIHIPRYIKISVGMNDTMASPRGASSIKTPGRTSVFFAVWGRNPRYCQRAAMPPRDSLISSA